MRAEGPATGRQDNISRSGPQLPANAHMSFDRHVHGLHVQTAIIVCRPDPQGSLSAAQAFGGGCPPVRHSAAISEKHVVT